MILDQNLILSGSANATTGAWTGQSLAQVVGAYVSTNTVDTAPLAIGGNQAPGWGKGEDLYAVWNILTTFTSAGAATVQFQIIESASADLSSPAVICETVAFPYAELIAGKQVVLDLPRSSPRAPKRYLGFQYTIAGATTTAGTVAGSIVHDIQDLGNVLFASGFSVT